MKQKKSKNQEMKQFDGRANNGAARKVFSIIEGLEAFANKWEYDLAVVKLAKKSGAEGFLTGGRVDEAMAIKAINKMGRDAKKIPEGFTSWKEFRESRLALISANELEEKNGLLMPTAAARRQAGEAQAFDYAEDDRMVNEYPPSIAGLSSVEIHKKLKIWLARKWKTVAEKYEAIGQ